MILYLVVERGSLSGMAVLRSSIRQYRKPYAIKMRYRNSTIKRWRGEEEGEKRETDLMTFMLNLT
jgi:hypothetical protein